MTEPIEKALSGIALVALCGAFAVASHGFAAATVYNEPAAAAHRATEVLDSTQFTDTRGQTYTLAHWRGKLVVVNFWATWCSVCRRELPTLEAAQQRLGAQGFQLIAPAVDNASAVRQELDLLNINYPVMVGTPAAMKALMAKLGNARGALPFSVFIAPDGHIIKTHLGALDAHMLDTLADRYLQR